PGQVEAVAPGDLEGDRVDCLGGVGAGRGGGHRTGAAPQGRGQVGAGGVAGADKDDAGHRALVARGDVVQRAGDELDVVAPTVGLGFLAADDALALQDAQVVGHQVGRCGEDLGELGGGGV